MKKYLVILACLSVSGLANAQKPVKLPCEALAIEALAKHTKVKASKVKVLQAYLEGDEDNLEEVFDMTVPYSGDGLAPYEVRVPTTIEEGCHSTISKVKISEIDM